MSPVYYAECTSFTTLLDFLRFGLSKANQASLFYGHGTENAWDDIYTLILETLHLPLDLEPQYLQAQLTEEEKKQLCHQLEQRIIKKVPVPYLTHHARFCGLDFFVDERVLIPRSPIAELIENHFLPWADSLSIHRILDLCTGSGCIAIACCAAFPDAIVDAVDISEDALAVAAKNQEDYGLEEQLTLIQSDCFDSIPKVQYDLIVSNPPYVGADEMRGLPDEYRHEPVLALQAAHNGLHIVEKILRQAADYLTDQGILVVEVGNSDTALMDAFPSIPFTWLDFEHGGHGVFMLTKAELDAHVVKS